MDFKLPIEYNNHHNVNEVIKKDLEMDLLYEGIFKESPLKNKWIENYSTDKTFLKESQLLFKSYNYKSFTLKEFYENEYQYVINEKNFNDKYQYLNINVLLPLNESFIFMQTLSYYNLLSPLFSLCMPLLILIIPFFILKIKGIELSIHSYKDYIYNLLKNTSMYKLFSNEISSQQRSSYFISFIFYIFQIYNNIISCISFYKNIHFIYDFIELYKNYCTNSIDLIENIEMNVNSYDSYSKFLTQNNKHKETLIQLRDKLNIIFPYKNTLSILSQIGYIMTSFYTLFYNKQYKDAIVYCYYLNEFNDDIHKVILLLNNKKLNMCKFDSNKNTRFKKNYYLNHMNEKTIKNDIIINENIIITGPNASGKTTLLKSILLNLILSQQIGMGCYEKSNIKLYDYFHSYLNIPDTSERDSLFQAEARRCIDILEFVKENKDKRHFCIFDELYSGTNPKDAVECAKLYLKGLTMENNTEFILTTHYTELCNYFDKKEWNDKIQNLLMYVIEHKDNIEFTYKINKGISNVCGGKYILKDLDYPEYLFNL